MIAVSAALLEKLEHQAEDQIALLVTDARVQIKNMAGDRAWDGVDRRTKGWDGAERRKGPDRRQPDVLEAPLPTGEGV